MRSFRILFLFLLIIGHTVICHATAVSPSSTVPPLGERWFSIRMNDEWVGFSHVKIEAVQDGFAVSSSGSAKFMVLGFSREASAKEEYLVNRDLSLKSFRVEQVLDGSPLRLTGSATSKGIRVTVEAGGTKKEKTLKAKGVIYPAPLLNLYPLLKGAAAGSSYRVQMLDVEAVKVKEVAINVIGPEKLPDGQSALHLRNDLYSFVDNDIWIDMAGNTIQESVRSGLIITRAEERQVAERFLAEAALSGRDLVLDFSLVKTDRPIERPAELRKLVVEISGVPASQPMLEGPGQAVVRTGQDKVLVTLAKSLPQQNNLPLPEAIEMNNRTYLVPGDRLPSDNPEIIANQAKIVGGEQDPLQKVIKLASWVAGYVEDTVTDSQSPLDTLKTRKGNCQSHARLYVSLARAAGLPSRFVSGLVYAPGRGFLYHSWAESYVKGWISVDPTFNQVPADATHIKLVEGDAPDDFIPLAGILGGIKAKIVEMQY